jgi:hypothetical protein
VVDASIADDQIDWVAKEAIRYSPIKQWLDSVLSPASPGDRQARAFAPQPGGAAGTAPAAPASTVAGGRVDAPPIRDSVFVSYARADQTRVKWISRLDVCLRQIPMLSTRVWNDSRIEAGVDWRQEIEYGLARAKAAVLLVGPNFLGSPFIRSNELPPLLKAAKEEGVRIFPLITDPSAYEESRLGQYQSFNDPKKYLSKLSVPEQTEILLDLARHVAAVFQPSA